MMKINDKILKILLIIIAIFFPLPSLIYIIQNRTVLNFKGNLEYCFLLTNKINRAYQAIIYTLIIILYISVYYLIIKKRNTIFKNNKQILKYILIISIIFILVIPFWCSDVFYYLGVGRLSSKYGQNPYYTNIKEYVDSNNLNIENDTVMQKGYDNVWADTTVVYGAIWTIICSIVSALSFGNIDIGLLIFKLVNMTIHIGNCYLLYKISKKKIFPLIYGLNPFVLIEGIANVHNDIFVVFFMLLAIYEAYKKKHLTLSMLFLALATDIKYFSIIILPFLIIYNFKDKDVKTRILKCIQYGTIFVVFAIIPYLLYIRDMNVFLGLIEQRERIAKGLYLVISMCFKNSNYLVKIIKNLSLILYAILYITTCCYLLFAKNIKFNKLMRELFYFVVIFLFLLITNFQPWYFMWLVPFIIWQKSNNIRLIVQMQLLTLIANIVFLVFSESYVYGVHFFIIFVTGIIICITINKKSFKRMESN